MKRVDAMKTSAVLAALLVLPGCATAQSGGIRENEANRVDGQSAREAGLQQDRFKVRREEARKRAEARRAGQAAQAGQPRRVADPSAGVAPVDPAVRVLQPTGVGYVTPLTGTNALSTATPTAEGDITLHKEELVVGKKEVPNGGVLVRKVIRESNVSQPVDLGREEYTIERIPGGQQSNAAFQAQEVYVPLVREEAVAGKKTHVTEIVRVRKQTHVDRQDVKGTVREESVEVVRSPAQR